MTPSCAAYNMHYICCDKHLAQQSKIFVMHNTFFAPKSKCILYKLRTNQSNIHSGVELPLSQSRELHHVLPECRV